jgi:hypothetical protein
MSGITRILLAAVVVGMAARSAAGADLTGPHGEGGKIQRIDGDTYISYTFIAAPGQPGQPAMFKVFRPRADPPDGLPKPRLLASDAGSWVLIGEGGLAPLSSMLDLDINGIVTWTFMPIPDLEKYRPLPAALMAYGHDPNFPNQQGGGVLVPTDWGARTIYYAYRSGRDQPPEIELDFTGGRRTMLSYLGYNDQGTWLGGDSVDSERLYVYRGDVHIPIPTAFDCTNSDKVCVSGGQVTRQPYKTPIPKNLRNAPPR